jgi:hypothetical protein
MAPEVTLDLPLEVMTVGMTALQPSQSSACSVADFQCPLIVARAPQARALRQLPPEQEPPPVDQP